VLTIRPDQMQVFDALERQKFIDEVTQEIAGQLAGECVGLSAAALRARVADGLDRAAAYGIRKKAALSMFIQLLFLAGPQFDQYPPVRLLLHHPALAPDDKIDRLLASMRDADWAAMRQRAGKAAQ
jgi:hypothetical protein